MGVGKNLPYKGFSEPARSTDISGPTVVPEDINNPVWHLAEYMVAADAPYKGGLYGQQHTTIGPITLPGSRYAALEIGDMITFDNVGFAARNITVFGQSFTGKTYLIVDIIVKENMTIINKAIEVNPEPIGTFVEKDVYPNPFN